MWLLFKFLLYLLIVGIVKSRVDYLQHPVKSCHVGDVVENACNKCSCTSKTVFECTPTDCNSKTIENELKETEPLCVPNQLYVQNLITCICTKDGRWPHKSCKDTFQSLPPRNVITHTCEPDTYIPIDCNLCRCGPDGKIANDRCTRNVCEDDANRRNNIATNTVYSKCEDKYWYSLAPCQFCFCVNQNKLVCNTGNYYTRNLDLGSYKLNICGKDLIKEAIELIPDNPQTLRMKSDLNSTSTNQIKGVTGTKSKNVHPDIPAKQNMAIDFIQVNNENAIPIQHINSANIKNSKEYYTDDMEAEAQDKENIQAPIKPSLVITTASTVQRTREIPVAEIMLQDDGENPNDNDVDINEDLNIKTKEDDVDQSIGLEFEFDESLTTEASARAQPNEKIVKDRRYEYEGETLKINIPKALNKAFQLAVRKSMVTLSKRTKCTPGATTVHECNMCFCLKNSKLLCTNHNCKGKKKA